MVLSLTATDGVSEVTGRMTGMRYGINVCTLGQYAEPALVVQLAEAAESAGWEAVFVWDHLAFAWGTPSADPWVVLAAVAQATSRVRLGTAVTPLARRRPAVVANAVATLDRLSQGRVVLGAGLGGVPAEFRAFGEPDEPGERASRLDEALELVAALWSGQPVAHNGRHYRVEGVSLAPLPVQQPRPPIWIGGDSPAARRRAARWDGWIIGGDDEHGAMVRSPDRFADEVADIMHLRGASRRYDVTLIGVSRGPDDPVLGSYATAGATWWLEHIHGRRAPLPDLLARITAGPPS
jgi:probable F420-dependent oxidoreductase